MKFPLLTLALSICIFKCFGQDTTFTLSKFESFSTGLGKVFRTEIKEIGSISSFNIAKVKTLDIGSGNQMSAIKLFTISYPEIINPHNIYIDLDDLDSVISLIEFLEKEADKLSHTKTENEIFYTFNMPNDVQISFSYPTAAFSIANLNFSRIFKNSRTIMHSSFLYVTKRRMHDLVDLLKKAKTTAL